jgi:hypothetical protein
VGKAGASRECGTRWPAHHLLVADDGGHGARAPLPTLRRCKRWRKNFFTFLIPVPRTCLILLASCPTRGRFLEAILQRAERKLAGPGRPGTVDGLMAGGALGGAAPSLGRARLPCRARWVHPPPQGCPLVPWRLPPLHPLARLPRDCQTSDALRRENAQPCPSFRGACALAQANPESSSEVQHLWIPGSRSEARPGMTNEVAV